MSGRKRAIVFAADARRDLRAILLYTRATWGRDQRNRYAERFRRSFDDLRSFPELGAARDDLFLECRALSVQPHVIYYRAHPDSIEIIRILHGSEDATAKLRGVNP